MSRISKIIMLIITLASVFAVCSIVTLAQTDIEYTIAEDRIDETSSGDLEVAVGGNVLYESFTQTDTTGGAIRVESTDGSVTLDLNGNFKFLRNSAYQFGGAVYSSAHDISSVNITAEDRGNIIFKGNSSAIGGAIFSGSDEVGADSKILLTVGADGNIVFISNTADLYGSAIASNVGDKSDVIFNGGNNSNIIISNNSQSGTSADNGGTISISSASSSLVFNSGEYSNLILTNNASESNGGVAFVKGNGELAITMGDGSYGLVSGNAAGLKGNFAYLGGENIKMTVDIGALSVFDMRDNIYAVTSDDASTSISITKDGAGTWKVGGTNTFTGYSSAISASAITTNINEGTLYLYRAGAAVTGAGNVAAGSIVYSNMTAGSSFNLKSAATLVVGGGNVINVGEGAITLGKNTTIAFDFGRAGTDTANPMLKLQTTGAMNYDTSIKLDMLSLHKTAGIYSLMNADVPGSFIVPGIILTLRGEVLADTRANGVLATSTSFGSKILYYKLTQSANLQSYALTWTGGTNGLWNATTDGNWSGGATKFLHGDKVTFNKAGTNDITINAGGVQVADMTVTGGIYNFAGGGITAEGTSGTSFTDAAGKLTITGVDTVVDFSGITSENNFAGGISLTSGTLRVGSIMQLGTNLNEFKFGTADAKLILGTLPSADGASYIFDGQGTDLNRIFMTTAATKSYVNIELEENVSVYFMNNIKRNGYTYGDGGGAIYASSVILKGSDYSTLAFLNNSISPDTIGYGGAINVSEYLSLSAGNYGKLIFDGNTANADGAIRAVNLGGGPMSANISVLDNSYIIFTDNKAGSQAGALSVSGVSASLIMTAGNNSGIIFKNNSVDSDSAATHLGGAIMASSGLGAVDSLISVEDNSNILFIGNKALGTDDGQGGAIANYSYTLHANLSLISGNNSNIVFSGNRVYGYDYSLGGAIMAQGNTETNLTLRTGDNGNIIFTDNMVSTADEYGFGGAIFVSLMMRDAAGITGTTVTNIIGGDNSYVLFRGNKYDVDMTDLEKPVGGIANAIYFDNYDEDEYQGTYDISSTLNLTSGTGGKILFYDPITAEANSQNRVTVNINNDENNNPTNGTIIFDGTDYYDADYMNRYYDMITDTTVFGGTVGFANNVIYGRTDESSTLELIEGATFLSIRSLGVLNEDIVNTINADVFTADNNIMFLNVISDTYNTLRVSSLTGTGTVSLGFNSDTAKSDVLDVSGSVNGSYDVTGFGLGNATLEVIPDVIMVDGNLKGTFGGQISVGFFNYRPELNADGNWDIVRKEFNDSSGITVIGLATLSAGWFTQLDNLTHRLGQVRIADHTADKENELWIRGFGSQIETKFNLANNINFKGLQYGTDFGYDIIAKNNENSRLLFGLFGGHSRADNSFDDVNESNGYTYSLYGGLYGTWIAKSGMYIDVVAKAQDFRTKMNLPENDGLKFTNLAYGASIEVGAPIKIGNGFFIEPRLQAAMMHMAEKEFTLNHGFDVNIDAMNIYHFVGAVKLGQNITVGDNDRELSYYLTAGIEDEISDGGKFRITDNVLEVDPDGVRTVFGAGLTYSHTVNTQLYFDFETSFGEKYKRPFAFSGGYKVQF